MAIDVHKNFAWSTVATAPNPANSGTELVVASGKGALFPATPFNATIWPINTQPISTNAEIVTVTTVATDTFTIVRARETSTAINVAIGNQIAATITAKTLTDAEAVNYQTLSYYENTPFSGETATVTVSGSTKYMFPFVLQQPVSFSYVRFPISAALTAASATLATSAYSATTWSNLASYSVLIYSQNTGNSSRSLAYVASSFGNHTYSVSISATGTRGSRWTCIQGLTTPFEGGTTNNGTGFSHATFSANINVSTSLFANWVATRYLDIPFASSLNPGNYWMQLGVSTASAGGAAVANFSMSTIALSQNNAAIGAFGTATNASYQWQYGIGSFTTNQLATTASLGFSNISSSASHILPYFQFIRQA